MTRWRALRAHGVFWRRLLRYAVLNVPIWLEPAVIGFWSAVFLCFPRVRRGLTANLAAIHPGTSYAANLLRGYRVLWNFAWTISENVRFTEDRVVPDWEFVGREHFDALRTREGGAIMLTAHMGSYDIGAKLFSDTSGRRLVMVRAPEVDPDTRRFEEEQLERTKSDGLKIDFNTKASDLALDLLDAVTNGEIVAIQGDRVTPGIATLPATLFGKRARVPAGPFALAMAARVPIYPLFIIRRGRRFYRLLTLEPIEVVRTGRNRDADFQRAANSWSAQLERVIREGWYQWYAFDSFEEAA